MIAPIALPRLATRVSFVFRKDARRLCNPGGVSPSLPIDRTCIAGALFIWGMSPHRALRGMTSLKSKSHGGAHGPGVERSSAGTCSKVRRVSFYYCLMLRDGTARLLSMRPSRHPHPEERRSRVSKDAPTPIAGAAR